MSSRKIKRARLYKVTMWWIVDVEDPEKRDARDAVEKVWKTAIKVEPNGFRVGPYREKKNAEGR